MQLEARATGRPSRSGRRRPKPPPTAQFVLPSGVAVVLEPDEDSLGSAQVGLAGLATAPPLFASAAAGPGVHPSESAAGPGGPAAAHGPGIIRPAPRRLAPSQLYNDVAASEPASVGNLCSPRTQAMSSPRAQSLFASPVAAIALAPGPQLNLTPQILHALLHPTLPGTPGAPNLVPPELSGSYLGILQDLTSSMIPAEHVGPAQLPCDRDGAQPSAGGVSGGQGALSSARLRTPTAAAAAAVPPVAGSGAGQGGDGAIALLRAAGIIVPPVSDSNGSSDDALPQRPTAAAPIGSGRRRRSGSAALRETREHKSAAALSRAQLEGVFHLPIQEAAKQLGVGLTILKRRCRQEAIPRWPGRKLKSVNKMIAKLAADAALRAPTAAAGVSRALDQLQRERAALMEAPATDLDTRTKKLRQAMFKHAHKLRTVQPGDEGVDNAEGDSDADDNNEDDTEDEDMGEAAQSGPGASAAQAADDFALGVMAPGDGW